MRQYFLENGNVSDWQKQKWSNLVIIETPSKIKFIAFFLFLNK